MSRKREPIRPTQTTKLSEVFKDTDTPIYYRLSVLEEKGERWRIINWGDFPRLVISTYSPRGFVNVLNVRLSIEGIEKAKKRLQKVLKLLETLEKLDAEKKITLKQEFKYEEKPVNIEDALREQLNDGE